MKKTLPIFIVIALIIAAGAFYLGMKYQQSKGPNFNFNRGNGLNNRFATSSNNFFGNQGRERIIRGQIIAKDDKSLTIKLPNGSSQIVIYSNDTKVEKSVAGQISDLQIGQSVDVSVKNIDNNILSANSILIR
jgi:hypothetical protein